MVDFDALIVGGWHNGLICAAYLGRAGLRVLAAVCSKVCSGKSDKSAKRSWRRSMKATKCLWDIDQAGGSITRSLKDRL